MKISKLLSLIEDLNLNGTIKILNQGKAIGSMSFLNKDISIYLNDPDTIFSLLKNFFPGQFSKNEEMTKNKLLKAKLNNISGMLTSFNVKVTIFQNNNEVLSIGKDVNSVLLNALGIKNVRIRNMARLLNLYSVYKKGASPLKEMELNVKDLNAIIKIQARLT